MPALPYNSLISLLFDYADFVWGDKNNTSLMLHQLQVLQNRAAKVILDAPLSSSATKALNKLGWHSLTKWRMFHRVMIAFKYLHGQIDFSFNIKSSKDVHDYNTRRKMDVRLPLAKRNWGQQKFVYSIFRDWNNLDPSIWDVTSLCLFEIEAKNVILI